jgi:hypothetical protein
MKQYKIAIAPERACQAGVHDLGQLHRISCKGWSLLNLEMLTATVRWTESPVAVAFYYFNTKYGIEIYGIEIPVTYLNIFK